MATNSEGILFALCFIALLIALRRERSLEKYIMAFQSHMICNFSLKAAHGARYQGCPKRPFSSM